LEFDLLAAIRAEFHRSPGAGRGNRTPTVLPPADFESAASTSSAIPAKSGQLTRIGFGRELSQQTQSSADLLRRDFSHGAGFGDYVAHRNEIGSGGSDPVG